MNPRKPSSERIARAADLGFIAALREGGCIIGVRTARALRRAKAPPGFRALSSPVFIDDASAVCSRCGAPLPFEWSFDAPPKMLPCSCEASAPTIKRFTFDHEDEVERLSRGGSR